jgi:MinD-like ATPase involved in chromosome partitioning or flagellar assembly
MADPSAGFRAQHRFRDPGAADAGVPPEWTAPTPPSGFPAVTPPTAAPVPPPVAPESTPSRSWRRWLPGGDGAKGAHREHLEARVRQPLAGPYRIAVLSLRGGVGKTTITATLGATLASLRDDRVVAVDANPDRGTLSQRVPLETAATVRHLLRDAEGIERYSDVRAYTSQGPSRLEVLASESDPAVSQPFSAEEYTHTLTVLERFYRLVLTDCATGLTHSAMSAVLDRADALVVVTSGAGDGAQSAAAILDWLDAPGHQGLAAGAVAVVNAVRPRAGKTDGRRVRDEIAGRFRAVQVVPFDAHLEPGDQVHLERLKPATRDALTELAAAVADGFGPAH